ncbi:unnamed protein product [Paramecium sonneborni]|uniref:WD40-repeat-containing domain n=1 Tax=Paramecium sonneborni TaxID=65129 RepID=A0A8S1KSV2_9CILI|nr:unnamed protein product [Paramecium sonneborni]
MQIFCTQVDHQQFQIIGICTDNKCQHQKPFCHYCLPKHADHISKLLPKEKMQEWINQKSEIVSNIYKQIQECKLSFECIINKLQIYLNINIEKLGLSQFDKLITNLCQIEKIELGYFKEIKQLLEQIKSITFKIFNNIKVQEEKNINQTQIQINPTFEIITKQKYNEGCRAIAFNKDDSIVVAGCDKKIKVFENKQGYLNQLQILSEHKDNVVTLNFMMKSDHFVSGSYSSEIIIWYLNQENQWACKQNLNGHSNAIYCVLLNSNEDQIISGSKDTTIKFWVKQKNWQCEETIEDINHQIYSLSLNEKFNQLIVSSQDQFLYVLQQSEVDNKWKINQKIKIDSHGTRLCFINDYQFVFQPYCKEYMEMYDMNINTQNFERSQYIPVQCGSNDDSSFVQLQYLQSKGLLVNKNGKFVNILRKKENNNFEKELAIQFDTEVSFGRLSQDGNFLISWDNKQNELIVRKFQEQK